MSACCAFASSSAAPPCPSARLCCCLGCRARRQARGLVRCVRLRRAWLPRLGSITPMTPQRARLPHAPPSLAPGGAAGRRHPAAGADAIAAAGDDGAGRRRPATRRWWMPLPSSGSGAGDRGLGAAPVCPFARDKHAKTGRQGAAWRTSSADFSDRGCANGLGADLTPCSDPQISACGRSAAARWLPKHWIARS
jgi:hypothetical protein